MARFLVLCAAVAVLTLPGFAQAAGPSIRVSIFGSDLSKEISAFEVPSANRAGGLSISVADLGGDGIPEFVLGRGVADEPRVLLRRQDGSEILNFLAYDKAMRAGINVAACDLDGDGKAEIATIPQRGAAPHLKIFNPAGTLIADTFAYAGTFVGGASLTCGNLDGISGDELVSLPSIGGGSHVRAWKLTDGKLTLWQEWFVFDESDRRGVVGTITDGVLTVASQHASTVNVKRYAMHSPAEVISEASLNADIRGVSSVVTVNGQTYLATISDGKLLDLTGHIVATPAAPMDAIIAAASDLDGNGVEELVTTASRPMFGEDKGVQSIVVDLSEQRLYAYENEVLASTFLVSTGRSPFATPLGEHKVLAKVPFVHYAGPGYDLGVIQYNLRFIPKFYIHYAPWHNNFGRPMSHGCVNVNLDNIKWIYNWAQEGIPVTVRS